MRTTLVLPAILTLLATSLPARSDMAYTSYLPEMDLYQKEIKASDIRGSDVNELFRDVKALKTQQEKDLSTIAELNSRIKSLEDQNSSLKRSQEDLSRRLNELSSKVK